jgi:hypothetical protein
MAQVRTTVVLRGLAVLAANAARKNAEIDDAVITAINQAAQDVHNESQRRVPVDTGNLKGSARVDPATKREAVATVSYGGTAAAYALPVHEMHASKSKYLEAPARELAPQFLNRITVEVRKSLT